MTSQEYGRFGALIGIIYVNNTHCRFMVYSTNNAEVLICQELELLRIVHHTGWLEYDAAEIWKKTQECIEVACQSLLILEVDPADIVAVGICNQRGTTVLWDKETGNALHNAIAWSDCRTASLLKTLLHKYNYNIDYTRSVSGLPLSTCFSALKIKWLQENVPAVNLAMQYETCLFGTLDSWLLWNLTGSAVSGVHSTDVTNAGYTGLMNIRTLEWDAKLCRFFRISMDILPRIRSNSEVYGFVIGGPLNGLPIAGCIGDHPATLLGQFSSKLGDNACTIDEGCFVFLNTGKYLHESSNGLLTSVAYKLGPDATPCYALEGAICNAGASVDWLQQKLKVNTEVNSTANVLETLTSVLGDASMISSSCSSSFLPPECGLAAKRCEVTFVPAFHGLYAPYWRYDARGMLLGLTSQTTPENVTQAAYEATGFQIHEILLAFKRDTPLWDWSKFKSRLIIGGDHAENNSFVQIITDIIGNMLQRPQTLSPSGLGAMMATGITMKMVSVLQSELMYIPPSDIFSPTTTSNKRDLLYQRWNYAVKKCLSWNNYETFEADMEMFSRRENDPYMNVRRSVPATLFLIGTFTMFILTKVFGNKN